jgi:hypothetical protein
MSDKIRKDLSQREAGRTFQRAGKPNAATEYEKSQEDFCALPERLHRDLARIANRQDYESRRLTGSPRRIFIADQAPLASSSFFFSVAQYSASDGSLSKSGLYPFVSYFERGTGMVVPVRNRPTPTLLRHETAQRAYAYSPCFAVRHTTACGRVVTINNERGFQTETHSHTQKPPRFPLTARAVALRLHAGVGNPPCRGGAVCVANVSGQRSPIASMCNWR